MKDGLYKVETKVADEPGGKALFTTAIENANEGNTEKRVIRLI